MRDVRAIQIAGTQFNRISRAQLLTLDFDDHAISHLVKTGRFVAVEQGVFAVAPVLEHDQWGLWKGATLTAPETFLSHVSSLAARDLWSLPRDFETVTRPGSGGPRRHGGILVFRSNTLAGECEEHRGIPITSVPRTLIDVAPSVSHRALARAFREAARLELTTTAAVADALGRHKGRRGTRALGAVLARYTGLPIERARSGAEVHALEILRDAGRTTPRVNERIAGEEADLSWAEERVILEIDGGPFHLDAGEDARKQMIWERAGWDVRRIDSDDVDGRPALLLALAPR